jgi:hypothetical protein
MDTAEVVDTSEQKDSAGHGLLSPGQTIRAPNQGCRIRAEGAVETFYGRRIDSAFKLGGREHPGEHGGPF